MEGFPAAKLQRHFWFDGKWCNGKHYNGKITAAFSTQSQLEAHALHGREVLPFIENLRLGITDFCSFVVLFPK